MGGSSSTLRDLSAEKQFELLQEKSSCYEEYLMWKNRLERMTSGAPQISYGNRSEPQKDYKKSESLRFSSNKQPFSIGDVVCAREANGQRTPEGLLIEIRGGNMAQIDFGDAVVEYPLESCILILSGVDFEVNDHVQVRPPDMSLYFTGVVIALHQDSQTMDILMAGDDPDDIEYNVPRDRVVKLNSGRPIALGHWRQLKHVVNASTMLRAHA